MSGKWIVNVKGSYARAGEICITREGHHGIQSYGWHDLTSNIVVFSSGGPCKEVTTKLVWDKLLLVAAEVAAEMNEADVKEKT